MASLGLLASVAACITRIVCASDLPVIDLGYGIYRATINNTGYGYYNFSNIRYAAPPVGELRFAAPIPPQGRNTTVNDGQQGAVCPQADPLWPTVEAEFLGGVPLSQLSDPSTTAITSFNLSAIIPQIPGTSEDCLFLDVVVPKAIFDKRGNGRKKRDCSGDCNGQGRGAPVLVWIYGGGFVVGAKNGRNSGNPATLLARARDADPQGVIYVAINYRLGLYGFLGGPTFQEHGTANIGLYDQELALRWVQKNIDRFGGDPNRVTVMGESAGGGSVEYQITAYGGLKGKVPFQQAILQSPYVPPYSSNAQAEAVFQKTLQAASYVTGRNITTTEELRSLSAIDLFNTNGVVVGLFDFGAFNYGPVVDGIFVPKLPDELILHGQFDSSVKVMLGHNSQEGLFFTNPFISDEISFENYLRLTFPAATPTAITYISQTLYPPIFDGSKGYTNQLGRTVQLVNDLYFFCHIEALQTAFRGKTYSYYFTVPPGLHGEDIQYTFFNGDITTPDDGVPVNATVAKALQDYITSFAIRGAPNEAGVPYFPLYGTNASTQLLGVDRLGTQVPGTAASNRCDFFQKSLFS